MDTVGVSQRYPAAYDRYASVDGRYPTVDRWYLSRGIFNVVPEKRNIGIGRKLGQAYSRYAHENNHIAYWSNAKNEGSKKTALSCGFELIRQARNYVKG